MIDEQDRVRITAMTDIASIGETVVILQIERQRYMMYMGGKCKELNTTMGDDYDAPRN